MNFREIQPTGNYIWRLCNLWLIGTCLGLLFEGKKRWGHLKIFFATSGYRYPEVVNIFLNISAKTKIFSKIFWGVAQGTIDS